MFRSGPSVLPVSKLNSHGSERKKEWLCLDSLTDIPPDCLVDSLDDAGYNIVLFYFQEVEHWGCLEITKRTIIVLLSWKWWKHTLTPHSRLHRAPKTWNIWTLFSNGAYLENVVGYFGTVTFYKYLAVMSIREKKLFNRVGILNVPTLQVLGSNFQSVVVANRP